MQNEFNSENARFANFEYTHKKQIMEREVEIENIESDMDQLQMQCVTWEREIEFKNLEMEQIRKENERLRKSIQQTRSFIDN